MITNEKHFVDNFFYISYKSGKKLANAPFGKKKKKKSIMPHFSNQLGKFPYFETQFSQNRVKPYSSVFKEPIVTF